MIVCLLVFLLIHSNFKFSKLASMLSVFAISAAMHEWVVCLFVRIISDCEIMCGLGFFYPVLLLMFGGVGVFFVYLTKNQVGAFSSDCLYI